jgi:hypothetical protein
MKEREINELRQEYSLKFERFALEKTRVFLGF